MPEGFWEWAWQRHHNVLSWYIRPFFLIAYMWFAHRRSLLGLLLTLLSLATSMFWFPAPARPEPWVQEFLAAELDYLMAPWTAGKVLLTLTVPVFLVLLASAFWNRSWRLGIAVLIAGAVGKVAWSIHEGGSSGWAVALPALIGLAACLGAVTVALKKGRSHREAGTSEGRRASKRSRGSPAPPSN